MMLVENELPLFESTTDATGGNVSYILTLLDLFKYFQVWFMFKYEHLNNVRTHKHNSAFFLAPYYTCTKESHLSALPIFIYQSPPNGIKRSIINQLLCSESC